MGKKSVYIRGASWIVNGARDKDSPLSIDDNSFLVIGHSAVDQLRTNNQDHQEES
jgi:hypothetical protein